MTNYAGQSITCTTILPNSKALSRIQPKRLSNEARFRLRFIEHYLNHSQNVTTTCQVFGITRSLFYIWFNRYNPKDLSSLENRSSRPHRVRTAQYSTKLIAKISRIRQYKDTSTYSAKKIAVILARDYPEDTELHCSLA